MLTHPFRALVAAVFAAGAASAQPCSLTGPFQPFSPGYHTPAGTPGLLIQSNTLFVDTDGDGNVGPADTGDRSFPMPQELSSPNPAPLNMRLSPTRDFLFSAGGAANSCPTSGRHVRIYAIPAVSGLPLELIFDECLPCNPNDGGAPLWYDMGITQGGFSGQPPVPNSTPLSTRRFAYIRTNASSSGCGTGQPQLRFYDLVAREAATFDLGLQPGAGVSLVSPGGDFMIFQHDLTNNPADCDVVVFRLCDLTPLETIVGSPPVLDNVSIVGIHAQVSASAAGAATIDILDGSSHLAWTADAPCCSTYQAPLGSCCVNNHCTVTTQADCAGVWVAGASCVNSTCVPTQPDPLPAINAPTPITVGDSITIPLSITNNGQTPASNIVATLTWPSSSLFTFVSATSGGAPFGSSTIRWNIPSLAPGATINLSASLTTGCFTGQYTLRFAVTATSVASREATQPVQINPRPSTPISVSLASVPSAPEPLRVGDIITHTITLTNPGPLPAPSITLSTFGNGIAAGQSSVFGSIVDCDGGTTCELASSDFLFRWSGGLNPGQTRRIVITTRLLDCVDPNFPFTALGQGQMIFAADSCGVTLGTSAPPQRFATAPAINAALQATNIQPGIIGPASLAPPGGMTVQPVRGAPALSLHASFLNTTNAPQDLGAISIPIPSNWSITSPPTNGAAFDSNTNEITFSGTLPPHAELAFDVGLQPTAIDASNGTLTINRSTPFCSRAIGGLILLDVPPLPPSPCILSANQFFGAPLTILERNVDTSPRPYLASGGDWTGIAPGAQGDLWLIGAPLTRFNPATLAFSQFPQPHTFAAALPQSSELIDGAFQPGTGDVILLARSTAQSAPIDTLLRFDPATLTTTIITEVPRAADVPSLGEVSIDPSGDILFCNHDQLLRYPGLRGPQLPPNSGTPVAVPPPSYTDPAYGALIRQRIWTFAPLCDNTFAILHATEFDHPSGLPFGDAARIFALSVFDPAAGTARVIDPLFAGELGFSGSWSYGSSLSPTFQIAHPYPFEAGSISMVQGEPGEVITGNDAYPAFHTAAIDLASGAVSFLQDPHQFGFMSALDIAYIQPASTNCSPAPACPGDFNQDGGIDGADVESFFATWEAGDPAADLNQDGGVDGSDVDTFYFHWESGC